MRRATRDFVLMLFGLLAILTRGYPQKAPATPKEQYRKLLEQYQRASSSGAVLSDEERLAFVGRVFRRRNKLALEFVELAERHPRDPIAVDALIQAVWYVNTVPWPVELVGPDDARSRAFERLRRDHLQSDKLGPVCLRVSYGYCREYGPFLRAVLEKNPHHEVRAQACLGLARFLANRSQRLQLISEDSQLAKEFMGLFGAEYLAELRREDRNSASKEAEELFERAIAEFASVSLPGGATVGAQAKVSLYEIRHLVVGKEAPDTAGVDQDGRSFKLSDYRGKVVLLDFWSEY